MCDVSWQAPSRDNCVCFGDDICAISGQFVPFRKKAKTKRCNSGVEKHPEAAPSVVNILQQFVGFWLNRKVPGEIEQYGRILRWYSDMKSHDRTPQVVLFKSSNIICGGFLQILNDRKHSWARHLTWSVQQNNLANNDWRLLWFISWDND